MHIILINSFVHFWLYHNEVFLLSQAEIMSLQQLLNCKNSEIESLQAQLLSRAPVSVDSAERGAAFSLKSILRLALMQSILMLKAI